MPLLSANCPFSRGICILECPSSLPCWCWSHSHHMGSIRAEWKRLWLAHQHRLLQKMSANLAWFTFVPCWQGGNHHSCPPLRAQGALGSAVFCWCKVAICLQSPIAAPCDLRGVHQFGQGGGTCCCAPSKPPCYKAFAVFMHSRRKGGNTNSKYIGKVSDSNPGCTWEMVVIVVMLNVKEESLDASAL